MSGPRQFGLGTIGIATDKEGGERSSHVAENTEGLEREKDAQHAPLHRLWPVLVLRAALARRSKRNSRKIRSAGSSNEMAVSQLRLK